MAHKDGLNSIEEKERDIPSQLNLESIAKWSKPGEGHSAIRLGEGRFNSGLEMYRNNSQGIVFELEESKEKKQKELQREQQREREKMEELEEELFIVKNENMALMKNIEALENQMAKEREAQESTEMEKNGFLEMVSNLELEIKHLERQLGIERREKELLDEQLQSHMVMGDSLKSLQEENVSIRQHNQILVKENAYMSQRIRESEGRKNRDFKLEAEGSGIEEYSHISQNEMSYLMD